MVVPPCPRLADPHDPRGHGARGPQHCMHAIPGAFAHPTKVARPRVNSCANPQPGPIGAAPMSETQSHDLLLRGGHVICPASGVDGVMDVAVRGGRIAAVAPSILPSAAKETIDVAGKLVLPGMIDTHAHVYKYVSGRFGLDADMVGVHSGVTTLVDQGGPSCMTFPGFRHFIAEQAQSRVYAFISSYEVGGLEGHYYPNLYSPDCIDVDATVRAADANRDLVRGIKGHAEIGGFARWGIKVIELSAEIGRKTKLPVYVHFGQLWGLPKSGA